MSLFKRMFEKPLETPGSRETTEKAFSPEGKADKIRSEMTILEGDAKNGNWIEVTNSELPEAKEEVLKLLSEDEVSEFKRIIQEVDRIFNKEKVNIDQDLIPDIEAKLKSFKEQLGI